MRKISYHRISWCLVDTKLCPKSNYNQDTCAILYSLCYKPYPIKYILILKLWIWLSWGTSRFPTLSIGSKPRGDCELVPWLLFVPIESRIQVRWKEIQNPIACHEVLRDTIKVNIFFSLEVMGFRFLEAKADYFKSWFQLKSLQSILSESPLFTKFLNRRNG